MIIMLKGKRKYAGVLELVDSADLKSVDIYIVRVRFPSPVPFAFAEQTLG